MQTPGLAHVLEVEAAYTEVEAAYTAIFLAIALARFSRAEFLS
jgi:hypothetical protein